MDDITWSVGTCQAARAILGNMEDNEYTSRLDAAEMLSVSKRTLDRYADTGRLRRYRRLGRVFYKTEDLRALNQPT